MEAVILQWATTAVSVFATALATYHFKGKESLLKQVESNSQEILRLKANQASDRQLLSQKMTSVEAELRDLKESVRDDVTEIKESVSSITSSMSNLAESQGELRGTIMATLKTPHSHA